MLGGIRMLRWLLGAVLVGLAAGGTLTGAVLTLSTPAQAQFWNDQRYPFCSSAIPSVRNAPAASSRTGSAADLTTSGRRRASAET